MSQTHHFTQSQTSYTFFCNTLLYSVNVITYLVWNKTYFSVTIIIPHTFFSLSAHSITPSLALSHRHTHTHCLSFSPSVTLLLSLSLCNTFSSSFSVPPSHLFPSLPPFFFFLSFFLSFLTSTSVSHCVTSLFCHVSLNVTCTDFCFYVLCDTRCILPLFCFIQWLSIDLVLQTFYLCNTTFSPLISATRFRVTHKHPHTNIVLLSRPVSLLLSTYTWRSPISLTSQQNEHLLQITTFIN